MTENVQGRVEVIATAVAEAAAVEQLGGFIALVHEPTHRTKADLRSSGRSYFVKAAIAASLLAVCVKFAVTVTQSDSDGRVFFLIVLYGLFIPACFGSAIVDLSRGVMEHNWDVYLFEGGFVRWSRRRALAYRWEDFTSVADKITSHRLNGSETRATYTIKFTRTRGRSVELGRTSRSRSLLLVDAERLFWLAHRAKEAINE